ncbi:hypothetical protein BJF81_01700 [Ornithinimicrobium sp. CNJ-824]|nr:hypothetical protein BJF81_01700 [Ornithinimicrobium sp. CNJ-824]
MVALAAAPLLLLSACSTDGGTDDAGQSDDAAATSAAPTGDVSELAVDTSGDAPQITRDGEPMAEGELPFGVAETQVEEVEAGDGDEVSEGDEVRVRYLTVNGTSGEEVLSTFEQEDPVTLDLSNEMLFPAFLEELPGRQAGDTLLMALPPAAAFGNQGNSQLGIGAEDTLVFYMEIVDSAAPLTKATGEEVEPEDGLPEVEADGESAATITIPDDAEAPDELVVQPLIEGEGAEVKAGQSIKVHYTGVKFSDGEGFDNSYDRGEPAEFPIGVGQVISGWDEGLVGQPVAHASCSSSRPSSLRRGARAGRREPDHRARARAVRRDARLRRGHPRRLLRAIPADQQHPYQRQESTACPSPPSARSARPSPRSTSPATPRRPSWSSRTSRSARAPRRPPARRSRRTTSAWPGPRARSSTPPGTVASRSTSPSVSARSSRAGTRACWG